MVGLIRWCELTQVWTPSQLILYQLLSDRVYGFNYSRWMAEHQCGLPQALYPLPPSKQLLRPLSILLQCDVCQSCPSWLPCNMQTQGYYYLHYSLAH